MVQEHLVYDISLRIAFEPASAVKSLTLFLVSILRCHKDIANFPGTLSMPGQPHQKQ